MIKGRVLPHIPGVFYTINSEPNDLRMNIEFPVHARRVISSQKNPSWVGEILISADTRLAFFSQKGKIIDVMFLKFPRQFPCSYCDCQKDSFL